MVFNLCAICGENEATTVDHLPPRGIYPKPIDGDMNLHTVPACTECNGGCSAADEEFKVIIGLETGEFRENSDKVVGSLAGTIGHNRRLANQISETSRRGFAKRDGSNLENVVTVRFESDSYNSVVARIVRGLYWKETGQALGLLPKIDVIPHADLGAERALEFKRVFDYLPVKKLNKETCMYKCLIDEDGTSIWAIQFFKKHTVFALAEARNT